MGFSRLPRFKRAFQPPSFHLTERDRAIVRLVSRHRLLRSSHIIELLGDRRQPVLRRLQLLYHHGYLERPRAQITYYQPGESGGIIYGIGNKGGTWLRQQLDNKSPLLSWGEKNRAVRGMFLEHAILVSDIMAAIELACRYTTHVRFISGEDFPRFNNPNLLGKPVQWKVKLRGGPNLGVIPDRAFAVETQDQNGQWRRLYYLLEADRGTMPVTRRHLSQTSFFRKLLAYEATWSQSIHRTKFGFNRFRVLTVTTSAARVKSLIEACSQLDRGHGLFLFADRSILENPKDILSANWKTGRQGEPTTLLD